MNQIKKIKLEILHHSEISIVLGCNTEAWLQRLCHDMTETSEELALKTNNSL